MTDTREIGIHVSPSHGWTAALLCMSGTGRELLRVTTAGEVVLPDDLTLAEARDLLSQLALTCVRAKP